MLIKFLTVVCSSFTWPWADDYCFYISGSQQFQRGSKIKCTMIIFILSKTIDGSLKRCLTMVWYTDDFELIFGKKLQGRLKTYALCSFWGHKFSKFKTIKLALKNQNQNKTTKINWLYVYVWKISKFCLVLKK